jgi:hypothetical protein
MLWLGERSIVRSSMGEKGVRSQRFESYPPFFLELFPPPQKGKDWTDLLTQVVDGTDSRAQARD